MWGMLWLANPRKQIRFGFKQPLVGEKRCVTTLITAAKETSSPSELTETGRVQNSQNKIYQNFETSISQLGPQSKPTCKISAKSVRYRGRDLLILLESYRVWLLNVGINTCFCIWSSRLWRSNDEDFKSDYLTWKWHRNKMYTIFLCLSFGSIKLLVW